VRPPTRRAGRTVGAAYLQWEAERTHSGRRGEGGFHSYIWGTPHQHFIFSRRCIAGHSHFICSRRHITGHSHFECGKRHIMMTGHSLCRVITVDIAASAWGVYVCTSWAPIPERPAFTILLSMPLECTLHHSVEALLPPVLEVIGVHGSHSFTAWGSTASFTQGSPHRSIVKRGTSLTALDVVAS
jgi:hypothetical protein